MPRPESKLPLLTLAVRSSILDQDVVVAQRREKAVHLPGPPDAEEVGVDPAVQFDEFLDAVVRLDRRRERVPVAVGILPEVGANWPSNGTNRVSSKRVSVCERTCPMANDSASIVVPAMMVVNPYPRLVDPAYLDSV